MTAVIPAFLSKPQSSKWIRILKTTIINNNKSKEACAVEELHYRVMTYEERFQGQKL